MHCRFRQLLPVVFMFIAMPVTAADTTDSESQRLKGYGWSLYDGLFHDTDPYLYSSSPSLSGWKWPEGKRVSGLLPGDSLYRNNGGGVVWRDPERGLINAISSYLSYNREGIYRLGAGGEWYHGSLTAVGHAGYLEGTIEAQPFAGIDLRWYARDNLSLQIGWEQLNDSTLGNLRFEYAPRFDILSGFSFFAGAAGDGLDNHYIMGGFRYSFGASPSLILRDRHDPEATRDRLSPYFRSLWIDP